MTSYTQHHSQWPFLSVDVPAAPEIIPQMGSDEYYRGESINLCIVSTFVRPVCGSTLSMLLFVLDDGGCPQLNAAPAGGR